MSWISTRDGVHLEFTIIIWFLLLLHFGVGSACLPMYLCNLITFFSYMTPGRISISFIYLLSLSVMVEWVSTRDGENLEFPIIIWFLLFHFGVG